jgi:hypothetical protein
MTISEIEKESEGELIGEREAKEGCTAQQECGVF